VLPLTEDCGLIEWVPRTHTLRSLMNDIYVSNNAHGGCCTRVEQLRWTLNSCWLAAPAGSIGCVFESVRMCVTCVVRTTDIKKSYEHECKRQPPRAIGEATKEEVRLRSEQTALCAACPVWCNLCAA
jgi:hypothetical protein